MTFKKLRKSKGKYWYSVDGSNGQYNKCKCGRFKSYTAKKCSVCSGTKKNGTFRKKLAKEKRFKSSLGYVMVYNPRHNRSNSYGYVFEHILVVEKKLGRKLKIGEVVHHKNNIRDDNRPENLLVSSKTVHNVIHNPRTNPFRQGLLRSQVINYCLCGRLKNKSSKRCSFCYRTRGYKKVIECNEYDISIYFDLQKSIMENKVMV